jgi:hypothetical protein
MALYRRLTLMEREELSRMLTESKRGHTEFPPPAA